MKSNRKKQASTEHQNVFLRTAASHSPPPVQPAETRPTLLPTRTSAARSPKPIPHNLLLILSRSLDFLSLFLLSSDQSAWNLAFPTSSTCPCKSFLRCASGETSWLIQLPCEPASSSATRFWGASRWLCKCCFCFVVALARAWMGM